MVQLTLTADQAEILSTATAPVIIVGPDGRTLGEVTRTKPNGAVPLSLSDEEYAEIKRRMASPEPSLTFDDIKAHLRSLEQQWPASQ